MPRLQKKKSAIWTYFVILSDSAAKYKFCQRMIKTSGNTTNLKQHMTRSHRNINIPSTKQSKIQKVS